MTPSLSEAQSRATEMGLTAAKAEIAEAMRADPARLVQAFFLLPLASAALAAVTVSFWALLLALPLAAACAERALPMRRYFIAFSPRNGFPRNLPAFARWAALYSGVMLVMIVLPPALPAAARWGIWVALAAGSLAFPLAKATLRARQVWRNDP